LRGSGSAEINGKEEAEGDTNASRTRQEVLFIGTGCSTAVGNGGTLTAQDVRYNSMPGTDFSKYHNYE
jgi:hypothetical protein